ncbi:hypothetical protein C8250_041025 [Streptomyces sp. So13.3]|uniref:hypothetical protein n=1 Tax=Streptomyces TaxID=1883 RepID=UPI00164DAD16|nr:MULTISPECIES: hypothetical protein [Streptomyces]MCZ4098427.1 hypothetical protein [Streptomyces sp. H39-C1]QNA77355.1 hypothetical protein C8250_041025 [Streptomyces sp. So13.3]
MSFDHSHHKIVDRTKNFTFTVPANVVGGAGLVRVCLDDGNYKDLLCHPYRRP